MYVLVYLWGKIIMEGRSPHVILSNWNVKSNFKLSNLKYTVEV